MGQPITVVTKPSSRAGVVRYETNRALTGMGHERFQPDDEILGDTPADELARRLFANGGIANLHVNGNVITSRYCLTQFSTTFFPVPPSPPAPSGYSYNQRQYSWAILDVTNF